MTKRRASRTKIKPSQKSGEKSGLNRHWRGLFLDCLAETSNVSEAARQAGINPSRAYKVRRAEKEFAQYWLEALWEGYEHLELEVLRRLREGDLQTPDGGKYDFANAIRLLSSHRENVVQAKAQHGNVSPSEVRASIDRKVEEIRRRVMQQQAARAGNDG